MQNQPFSNYSESNSENQHNPRGRLWVIGAMFLFSFSIVAIRVVYIQTTIADRFVLPWDDTHSRVERIPSRDGRILSRDGAVLAYDKTRYNISVDYRWLESPPDPAWLKSEVLAQLAKKDRKNKSKQLAVEQSILQQRQQLWESLAQVTHLPTDQLVAQARATQVRIERMVAAVESRRRQKLALLDQEDTPSPMAVSIQQVIYEELTTSPDRSGNDPLVIREELQPHPIISDVSLEVAAAIQSQPARFPGVHIESATTRVYPFDNVAPHVIGLRRSVPDGQGTLHREGEDGIERSYQRVLSGKDGAQQQVLSRRGEILEREQTRMPLDGQDVSLTIDSRLQKIAEDLLDASLAPAITSETDAQQEENPVPNGGCVLLMDVWSGELLVAACAPRHSLELLMNPEPQRWNAMLNDPRQPFFPRITRMALPPGSVFKVITAVAALEEGAISANDVFHCQGYLNNPDQHRCLIYRRYGVGHGDTDLGSALRESCNVYFYRLAQTMGPDPLCDWSRRFGFGQISGIDLPGEKPGLLPNPHDPETANGWYPGSTLQLAIGQGSLLATPLQICRMMAAVANGGSLVTPTVVMHDSRDAESSTSPQLPTLQKIPGLHEQTLTTIRQGLEMVVNHPRGTGKSAYLDALTLAGKTGTAEVAGQQDHAWFAGYMPAKSPRYAFIVVLENGGSGGSTAGPIVKELAQSLLNFGYLQPDQKYR